MAIFFSEKARGGIELMKEMRENSTEGGLDRERLLPFRRQG